MQFNVKVLVMAVGNNIVVTFYQDNLQGRKLTSPKDEPIPIVIHIAMEQIAQEQEFFGMVFMDEVRQGGEVALLHISRYGNARLAKMPHLAKMHIGNDQRFLLNPINSFLRDQ